MRSKSLGNEMSMSRSRTKIFALYLLGTQIPDALSSLMRSQCSPYVLEQ